MKSNPTLNCIILLSIFVFFISSCSDDDSGGNTSKEVTVTGAVQKGPFVSGSTVNIQELSDGLIQTGSSFSFSTINDFGEFEVQAELTSNYLEIQTTGFYFNEVSGNLTDANLTLRAIANVETTEVNVNLLTTLTKDRIKALVEEGATFSEGKDQAEDEVLQAFGLSGEFNGFETLDISQSGEANGALLAMSIIVQENRSIATFSEFISKLSLDLAQDGQLTNENTSLLKTSAFNLLPDLNDIRNNLNNRYQNLGLSVDIPDFESYVTQVANQTLAATTVPEDEATNVTDNLVTITFNAPILRADGSQIESANLTDIFGITENGESISFDGVINANKDIVRLQLPILKSNAQYNVSLNESVQNLAGERLGDLSFSFASASSFLVSEATQTFLLNRTMAERSVMQYNANTQELVILDFSNEEIIRYNPTDGTHTTTQLPIPEDGDFQDFLVLIPVQQYIAQLIGNRFYLGYYYFDLSSNTWVKTSSTVVDAPWYGGRLNSEDNINHVFISESQAYGAIFELDEETSVSNIQFFSYDVDSEDYAIITDVGDLVPLQVWLQGNDPVYHAELNQILFIFPSNQIGESYHVSLDLDNGTLDAVSLNNGFENNIADRNQAAIFYNPNNDQIILYGGNSSDNGFYRDVWAYDALNETWIEYLNAGTLELRPTNNVQKAFVPEMNALFIFAGFTFYDELIKVEFQ